MLLEVEFETVVAGPMDGRHARSQRTRILIVEAFIALLEEGVVHPDAEQIAKRAGVSRRAIFNHFHDQEELFATARQRYLERAQQYLPKLPIEGTLEKRIDEFTIAIAHFYERIHPLRRLMPVARYASPTLAAGLEQANQFHRAMVAFVFDPELRVMEENDRAELLAALATALSFSTWEELCANQQLSREKAIVVMQRILWALLANNESANHQPKA